MLVASIKPWSSSCLSDGCCPQPACEDPHYAKPEVGHFHNQRQKAIFIDRKYCKVSRCDGIGGSRTLVDDGHFAKNVAAGQPLQQLRAASDLDRAGLDDIEDTALLAAMKNDLSSLESKVLAAVARKDTEIEVGISHAQFSSETLVAIVLYGGFVSQAMASCVAKGLGKDAEVNAIFGEPLRVAPVSRPSSRAFAQADGGAPNAA